MLSADELRQLSPPLRDAILAKLQAKRRDLKPAFIEGLHPKQKAFVQDPAKRKCALAGRRAGKSEGIAAWLMHAAPPGETSVFIARTAGHARRILWETLKRIDGRHKLGLRFREDILTVELPNGHKIWLSGCKDWSEAEKFRGPRYWKVAVDEAGSFPPDLLKYLVDDIFDPALMDLDGELALTGSPGPIPAGYFYEKTTGDGGVKWSTHTWTCLDNPYVKGAPYLEQKLKENGWKEDHPTFRREYLGLWVLDIQALVLPFEGMRNGEYYNTYYELPGDPSEYSYGLCVDLGAGENEPSTAFVIGAVRKNHPEFYVPFAEKKAGMYPTAIAAHAQQLIKEWGTRILVLDEGALGRGYGDEFRKTFAMPFIAAEKKNKRGYLELVGGDVRSGLIKIHPFGGRELIGEMQMAQWNEDRDDVDDRFPHHTMDGMIYLARMMLPRYRPEHEPAKPGSPEWWEAERQRIRKAANDRVLKSQRAKRRWG